MLYGVVVGQWMSLLSLANLLVLQPCTVGLTPPRLALELEPLKLTVETLSREISLLGWLTQIVGDSA